MNLQRYKSSRLSSHQSASHIRPRNEAFVTHFQRVSQEKRGRLGGEISGCGDDRNKLQSTYQGGHGRAVAENEEMMREKLESGLPVLRWCHRKKNPTRWHLRDHDGVVTAACTSSICGGEKTNDGKRSLMFFISTNLIRNKYHFNLPNQSNEKQISFYLNAHVWFCFFREKWVFNH